MNKTVIYAVSQGHGNLHLPDLKSDGYTVSPQLYLAYSTLKTLSNTTGLFNEIVLVRDRRELIGALELSSREESKPILIPRKPRIIVSPEAINGECVKGILENSVDDYTSLRLASQHFTELLKPLGDLKPSPYSPFSRFIISSDALSCGEGMQQILDGAPVTTSRHKLERADAKV